MDFNLGFEDIEKIADYMILGTPLNTEWEDLVKVVKLAVLYEEYTSLLNKDELASFKEKYRKKIQSEGFMKAIDSAIIEFKMTLGDKGKESFLFLQEKINELEKKYNDLNVKKVEFINNQNEINKLEKRIIELEEQLQEKDKIVSSITQQKNSIEKELDYIKKN